MGEKVRVGIIGAGFAGHLHAESYQRCPSAELVAVADPNKKACQTLKEKYGITHSYLDYRKLLARDDIDLVSACVPTFLHHEVVLAALTHGKHVVCEKPLALNVVQAEQMVEAARRENLLLMYAEDWMFAPALRRALAICREGAIGEVLVLRAKESHSGSHSPFAKELRYCGGGALIHLGIHPIGFGLAFFRGEVRRVWGVTSGGGEANLMHGDFEGEDWGLGIIEFADGRLCQVEANYITQGGMDDVVEFYGTEGVIKVDLTQGSPLKVFSRRGLRYTIEKADLTTGWSFPAVDEYSSLGYEGEIAHFVDCVLGKSELKVGVRGEDGLQALRILEAIYQAAKGKAVSL